MARFIRLPEVIARTGLKRSSIYAGMHSGTFPQQIPLGQRAVAWDASAVDAWIEERTSQAEGHTFIQLTQAAVELGLEPGALQPFVENGALATRQVGKHLLVKKSALENFQEQHAAELREMAA